MLNIDLTQCGSDFLRALSSLVSVSFGHSPVPLNSCFFFFFLAYEYYFQES